MAEKRRPSPPAFGSHSESSDSADKRERFARKAAETPEDGALTSAFIDGKIEIIRGDPKLTDAEKAVAVAELESRRMTK